MTNKRAVVLCTIVLFGFVLTAIRLGDLMLLNHERLSDRAKRQQVTRKELMASRGLIFDRQGRKLALNVDLVSVYCDARQVIEPKRTARALAENTGVSYKTILARIELLLKLL